MEDQVVSSSNSEDEESSSLLKYTLLIVAGVLILIGVGGGSYMLGTKTAQVDSPPPTTAALALQPTSKPKTLGVETDPDNNENSSQSATTSANSRISATPTPLPKSKILPSVAKLDGFRASNGTGNSTLDIRAGRNSTSVTRGFVTFDLKGLPTGAKITSATLRLYQAKVEGNPYISGGDLKLDHLIYGDSLDDTDYSLASLLTQFVVLAKTPRLEWKEADVTQAVKNDVANARPSTQFRIRFTTELTDTGETEDLVHFESEENNLGTGNKPQLLVKYY